MFYNQKFDNILLQNCSFLHESPLEDMKVFSCLRSDQRKLFSPQWSHVRLDLQVLAPFSFIQDTKGVKRSGGSDEDLSR